jgi:hypothetical protein
VAEFAEGFLDGVLGESEIAETADEGADSRTPSPPKDSIQIGH